MTPTSTLTLHIPGDPKGKGRPRSTRQGRVYTDAATVQAEDHIRDCWLEAGSPRLGDCALEADVLLMHARPKDHYLKDGRLSLIGQRVPTPVRKPDVDNALKLILDALNGLAYKDDAQISKVVVRRKWSLANQGGTNVTIREMP